MQIESTSHSQHGLPEPHYDRNLPKVRLEICRGRARNKHREVTQPVFLIGTAQDCDLVLSDPQYPESYAYLFLNEEDVSIRYLDVGPELMVEGQPVQSAQLRDGERIQTGPYEFRIHIDRPVKTPLAGAAMQSGPNMSNAEEDSDATGLAEVRQLLADVDIRKETQTDQDKLGLYVDDRSPWQSVTNTAGVSVRRNSA